MTRHSRRDRKGYNLAEVPAAMILLFLGLFVPLLIIASLSYRGFLMYWTARDCANKAARSSTFSLAQTNANTAYAADSATISGVTGTQSIQIVIKPIAGGPVTVKTTALPAGSVDPKTYMYFIRSTINAQISPLVGYVGNWFGLNIPGLTGPFNLMIVSESYDENPTGLTN